MFINKQIFVDYSLTKGEDSKRWYVKEKWIQSSVTKFEKPSMIALKFEEKSLIRKTGGVQSN